MKRFMILATAALLTTGAFAQTATVEIAPEQRTKIKQYVTTQKVAPVTVKERSTVTETGTVGVDNDDASPVAGA